MAKPKIPNAVWIIWYGQELASAVVHRRLDDECRECIEPGDVLARYRLCKPKRKPKKAGAR